MRIKPYRVIMALLVMFPLLAMALDQDTLTVMPFVGSSSGIYCATCHPGAPRNFPAQGRACDNYCQTCHTLKDKHHAVGMTITEELPATMKLATGKKLACVTCHVLSGDRYADKPYKSQSLFESIARTGSKHRTYYLPMRNNRGQLCKMCH